MSLTSKLMSLVRRLARRSAVEQDLNDEAQAFVDLLTDEKSKAA